LINYHIHTKRCGHAFGDIEEYIREAKRLGLREIGFSDHVPVYFFPKEEIDPTIAMPADELPAYVEEVLNQQKINPDITIRLGLEADFAPGYEDELKRIIGSYPFDYVLGSIHFLDGWGYDNPEFIDRYHELDINELYQRYFKTLRAAAASGLFDVLAHPDLIKKFGFLYQGELTEIYEETAKVIKASDLCIEVNTSGLRVPVKEIYPSKEFLEICYRYEIPITIGTDAHCPDQVGMGLEEAFKLVKEVGYRQVAVFTGRERSYINI